MVTENFVKSMLNRSRSEKKLLYVKTDLGSGILETVEGGVMLLMAVEGQSYVWEGEKPVFNFLPDRPKNWCLVDLNTYRGPINLTIDH